jgi:hypothetical protein
MNLLTKINNFLANDLVQRLCYLAALLVWIYTFHFAMNYNSQQSSWILYFFILFPAILLVIQILFNKTFTWAVIFLLIAAYSTFMSIGLLSSLISQGIRTSVTTNTDIIPIILVLSLITLIVYKLKPAKKSV